MSSREHRQRMKIYLNEISDQETELDFTQEDPWVVTAVCRVDEKAEEASQPSPKNRLVHTHLSLRKVDDVFVVSGKIDTFVELICSRFAISFKHFCRPNISALFC